MSDATNVRRGRALRKLQRKIERYYGLEQAPDVLAFVAEAKHSERETLLVRQTDDGIELRLMLPHVAPPVGANDGFLQLLEGVSHFVYLAERARTELPTTQLELELQAEVDKFVMLSFELGVSDPRLRRELHARLFDRVYFLHPAESEAGSRYRLANELAARFTARFFHAQASDARSALQRFYRAGQSEKIRLARAA